MNVLVLLLTALGNISAALLKASMQGATDTQLRQIAAEGAVMLTDQEAQLALAEKIVPGFQAD